MQKNRTFEATDGTVLKKPVKIRQNKIGTKILQIYNNLCTFYSYQT
jgi:hypothetical protein